MCASPILTRRIRAKTEVFTRIGDGRVRMGISKSSGKEVVRKVSKGRRKQSKTPDLRKVSIPQHRMSPLKKHWNEILEVLVTKLNLECKVDPKKRLVMVRSPDGEKAAQLLDKAAEYLKAFLYGFELRDAVALLRLDDIFMESFAVKDVKSLQGDHLNRAIGRVAGREGQTKHGIENATRTRVVVANQMVHVLGTSKAIKQARTAISCLIMGTPQGKVHNNLRLLANRTKS